MSYFMADIFHFTADIFEKLKFNMIARTTENHGPNFIWEVEIHYDRVGKLEIKIQASMTWMTYIAYMSYMSYMSSIAIYVKLHIPNAIPWVVAAALPRPQDMIWYHMIWYHIVWYQMRWYHII